MLRVRAGDEASFGVLLDRYRAPVIHFLYRMVQNQAVSEELAQDVFLRVYRSRATYEPTAKFTTWLFRIATHLALNWIRDGVTKNCSRVSIGRRAKGQHVRSPIGAEPWNRKWCTGQDSRRSGRRSNYCRRNSGRRC